MKKMSFVMSVLLIINLFAGCGQPASSSTSSPQADSVRVVVAQGVDPGQLDGHSPGGVPKCNVDFAIHSMLLTRDEDGTLVGALAEDWYQVDDTTWEFKLRENAKFQNGESVTAETIAANIQRIINPPSGLSTFGYIAGVTEAVAVDERTVQIKSEYPMATLPDSLPLLGMMAMESINADLEEVAVNPIGAGPFRLVEWVKDDHILLEKNPDFWGGDVAIDEVMFVPISENDVRVSALLTGDVDILTNVPISSLEQLKADPNVEVFQAEGPRIMYVNINTEEEGPLQDVKVRQALNLAIDKDSIYEYILKGTGSSYGQPVGSVMTGYNPDVAPYDYDVEAAKALLAEAGYPDGFTVTFNISPGRFSMDKEIAEAIASQLDKIGVTAEINSMDWASFSDMRKNHELSGLALSSLGYGSYDGYSVLYDGLRTGANYSTYSDPTLDAMIEEIATIVDLEQREAALQEAMQYVHDEAAWIFLGSIDTIFAARTDLENYRAIVEYLYLGDAYRS